MNLGRLLLPALRWSSESGFGHEEQAIQEALEFGAGGFILFGGTADSVRQLTADLRSRAERPLLIASDLERGAGQQISGCSEFPPPLALASLGDPVVSRWAGAVTAREALEVGINWVLAPVADLDSTPENPIVQSRSFGAAAAQVATHVQAWIEGCQDAGALACAKHYPGHGRTRLDSHSELPVVDSPVEALRQEDEAPFRAAVLAGVSAIMTAHVAFSALDPLVRPATFSPPILRHLRDGYGFDGVVVTDAMIMEGARHGRSEGHAAVEALRAGCDLLLYPKDPGSVLRVLRSAVSYGVLPIRRIERALARYERALSKTANGARLREIPAPFRSPEALADALLARGELRGRPTQVALRPPLRLDIVDDDLGGPYPPSSSQWVARGLDRRGLGTGEGGSRILLVFAEPRGWKGRAGLGAESKRALQRLVPGAVLVVLFGHPRLATEIPGDAPVLLAWHRQRLMQEAVVRWIMAQVIT